MNLQYLPDGKRMSFVQAALFRRTAASLLDVIFYKRETLHPQLLLATRKGERESASASASTTLAASKDVKRWMEIGATEFQSGCGLAFTYGFAIALRARIYELAELLWLYFKKTVLSKLEVETSCISVIFVNSVYLSLQVSAFFQHARPALVDGAGLHVPSVSGLGSFLVRNGMHDLTSALDTYFSILFPSLPCYTSMHEMRDMPMSVRSEAVSTIFVHLNSVLEMRRAFLCPALTIDQEVRVLRWVAALLFRVTSSKHLSDQLLRFYAFFGSILHSKYAAPVLVRSFRRILRRLYFRVMRSGELADAFPHQADDEAKWTVHWRRYGAMPEPCGDALQDSEEERQEKEEEAFDRVSSFEPWSSPSPRETQMEDADSVIVPVCDERVLALLGDRLNRVCVPRLFAAPKRQVPFYFHKYGSPSLLQTQIRVVERGVLLCPAFPFGHFLQQLAQTVPASDMARTYDRVFAEVFWPLNVHREALTFFQYQLMHNTHIFEGTLVLKKNAGGGGGGGGGVDLLLVLQRPSIDELVDVWTRWIRRTIQSDMATLDTTIKRVNLQCDIIKSPDLTPVQKKKMVMAILSSLEERENHLVELAELLEFKHWQSLLNYSISYNVVPLIRVYFTLLFELFVKMMQMKLFAWMDHTWSLQEAEAEGAAAVQEEQGTGAFPVFGDALHQCIRWTEIPEVDEDVVVNPPVDVCRRKCWLDEELEETTSSRTQTLRFMRKYGGGGSNDEEQQQQLPWQTLVFRFLVGLANSNFVRYLLELGSVQRQEGLIYFFQWQPAILRLARPFQMQWTIRKSYDLYNKHMQLGNLYWRLFHFYKKRNYFPQIKSAKEWKLIQRCKYKDKQLETLQSFLKILPSMVEFHEVRSRRRLRDLFRKKYPEREPCPILEDAADSTSEEEQAAAAGQRRKRKKESSSKMNSQECGICYESVDPVKSLGVFTNCAHFFCLPCACKAFFKCGTEQTAEEIESIIPFGDNTRPKTRETCICPFCRTPIGSTPSRLLQSFGRFCFSNDKEHSVPAPTNWQLSYDHEYQFVLPVLYLLNFHEEEEETKEEAAVAGDKRPRVQQTQIVC